MYLFSNVLSAVSCAKKVLLEMQKRPVVALRIGLHEGDVILKDSDVYGDAINVVSRIESMGVTGNVLLLRSLYQKVKNQTAFEFQPLGSFGFKNIINMVLCPTFDDYYN